MARGLGAAVLFYGLSSMWRRRRCGAAADDGSDGWEDGGPSAEAGGVPSEGSDQREAGLALFPLEAEA